METLWDPAPPGESYRIRPAHVGEVNAVAATGPSGGPTVLVSGGSDGRIQTWLADDPTGRGTSEQSRTLSLGHGAITCLGTLTEPDGRSLIFAGGADHRVQSWDAHTGKAVATDMFAPSSTMNGSVPTAALDLARRPDGSVLLLTANRDGSMSRWVGATGYALEKDPNDRPWFDAKPLFQLPPSSTRTEPSFNGRTLLVVRLLSVSGRIIAAAGYNDGQIGLWDASTGDRIRSENEPLFGHRGSVTGLLSGDQVTNFDLLSCGEDGLVKGWHADESNERTLLDIGQPVHSITLSTLPAGKTVLVTGHADGSVGRWDAETWQPLNQPALHRMDRGSINSLAATSLTDGTPVVLIGGRDGVARLLDVESGAWIGPGRISHRARVTAIATGGFDDRTRSPIILTGGDDGVIRRWTANNGASTGQPITQSVGVNSLAVVEGSRGGVLVALGDDHRVRRWDLSSSRPLSTTVDADMYLHVPVGILAVSLTPDRPNGRVYFGPDADDRQQAFLVIYFDGRVKAHDAYSWEELGEEFTLPNIGSSPLPTTPIGFSIIDRPQGPTLLVLLASDGKVYRFNVNKRRPHGEPLDCNSSDALRQFSTSLFKDDASMTTVPLHQSTESVIVVVLKKRRVVAWNAYTGENIVPESPFSPDLDHGFTPTFSTPLILGAIATPNNHVILVVGTEYGRLRRLLVTEPGSYRTILPSHLGEVTALSVSIWPESQKWLYPRDEQRKWLVVSGGDDGTVVVRIFDGEGLVVGSPDPRLAPATNTTGYLTDTDLFRTPLDPSQVEPAAFPGDVLLDWDDEPRLADELRPTAPPTIDDEAAEDSLGRTVLAAHLRGMLQALSGRNENRSTVVHIDGLWGAGKSTLAHLALKKPPSAQDRGPVDEGGSVSWDPLVIRYDAWREHSIEPVWWSLGSAIYHGIKRSRCRGIRRLMEVAGVISWLHRNPVAIVALVLSGATFSILWDRKMLLPGIASTAAAIGGATVIVGFTLSIGRALFWWSPRLGQLYVRSDDGGMGNVATEVTRIRGWTAKTGSRRRLLKSLRHGLGLRSARRPIVIVVDDLDRCKPERIVGVLEALHTILRGTSKIGESAQRPPSGDLMVLVLADGRWLRRAWETVYTDFLAPGDDPLRGMGSDFLQKIFDHTVLVPSLTADQQLLFTRNVTMDGQELPEAGPQIDDSEEWVNQPYGPRRTGSSIGQVLADDAGVDIVYSERFDSEIAGMSAERRWEIGARRALVATQIRGEDARVAHLLTRYGRLLPGSPREIKRVVNTFLMLLALRDHLGHHESKDALVRASLILVRFPDLVDHLLHEALTPEITAFEVLDILGGYDVVTLAACYGRHFSQPGSG